MFKMYFLHKLSLSQTPPIRLAYLLFAQSPSHVQLFKTPWTATHQAFLSLTISWSLPKFTSTGDDIQPSHPPSPSSPPTFNLSQHQHQLFSNELAVHIRWPKYWNFSFSISPSNDYSGLISFKTDWFDLLAVQGMLKSLLQCQSSEFFGALPSFWSSSHIHI